MDVELVKVLSRMKYGLYFLCTGNAEEPYGMLVSWVSQVSGDPPLIMCAVRKNRGLLPHLQNSGAYCLCLLPEGDSDLRARLARPADQRFSGLDLMDAASGQPVPAESLAWLGCQVREVWRPGDHYLMVGEVTQWGGIQDGPAMGADETGYAYLGLT